ncbi:PLDc N-terminal domain-containing protein [Pseudoglutamicibacter cumminsii]|uniref:PLD nuclease N-terminal domain-containing protein n=1 Tax=Pseudoglutamicibacter cumminsii TaxID=156979 RepID=UPI0025555479|nr:PLDc N-terminal domain-containing protein [Pseudoglutamicibacter cumminsii]MDZ3745065.1 PLDc N-terminal domain-containing protein [Pseudoglutamicibacter cumminsii]
MRWLVFIVPLVLVFILYALFNAIGTPQHRVRSLPKGVWIAAIIVLPVVGAVLWLTLGSDKTAPAAAPRGKGPDDDAAFLERLNLERDRKKMQQDALRREKELEAREAALRKREQAADQDRRTELDESAEHDGDDGAENDSEGGSTGGGRL